MLYLYSAIDYLACKYSKVHMTHVSLNKLGLYKKISFPCLKSVLFLGISTYFFCMCPKTLEKLHFSLSFRHFLGTNAIFFSICLIKFSNHCIYSPLQSIMLCINNFIMTTIPVRKVRVSNKLHML